MGSKASIQLSNDEIQQLQVETGFTRGQIARLYNRFTSLDKSNNSFLSREDFLRIPELAINPLSDRIVHAFFVDLPNEEDGVNFKQFVKTLAHFQPVKEHKENKLNSRDEKLKFAFKMYDVSGSEQITRDDLLAVLHMMVGSNISEDQLTSIADRTLIEADQDCDGMISFDEFCKIMEKVDVEQKMSIRFLN